METRICLLECVSYNYKIIAADDCHAFHPRWVVFPDDRCFVPIARQEAGGVR